MKRRKTNRNARSLGRDPGPAQTVDVELLEEEEVEAVGELIREDSRTKRKKKRARTAQQKIPTG